MPPDTHKYMLHVLAYVRLSDRQATWNLEFVWGIEVKNMCMYACWPSHIPVATRNGKFDELFKTKTPSFSWLCSIRTGLDFERTVRYLWAFEKTPHYVRYIFEFRL